MFYIPSPRLAQLAHRHPGTSARKIANPPKMRNNAKQAAKKMGGLKQIGIFFKPKEKPKEAARVGRPREGALGRLSTL